MLGIGARAAHAALRPFAGVASAAASAGLDLERRAVGRVVESPELERLAGSAFDSRRFQEVFARALESEGARQLVDTFFESSLFEHLITRLLESRELWGLVDEIADSPAVAAAITGQSLGFADQVGAEVRQRSRRTDAWLEQAARRLSRRHPTNHAAEDEGPG